MSRANFLAVLASAVLVAAVAFVRIRQGQSAVAVERALHAEWKARLEAAQKRQAAAREALAQLEAGGPLAKLAAERIRAVERLTASRRELVNADVEVQRLQRSAREAAAGKVLGPVTLKDGTVIPPTEVKRVLLDAIEFVQGPGVKTVYLRQLPDDALERFGIGTPNIMAFEAAKALRAPPPRKPRPPADPEAIRQRVQHLEDGVRDMEKRREAVVSLLAQKKAEAAAATEERAKALSEEMAGLQRQVTGLESQISNLKRVAEQQKARLP